MREGGNGSRRGVNDGGYTSRTRASGRAGSRSGRASGRTRPPRQNAAYPAQRPELWTKLMDALPDNVWANRVIVAVVLLVLVFILVNLVTCIGGAFAGRADDNAGASSEQASGEPAAAAEGEASSGEGEATAQGAAPVSGVESPWVEGGVFTTGDATLDAYVKQLCDGHSTDGATFDANAYDTYLYVSRTDYVERENNQSPWGSSWSVEYAKQYFEEGNTGNCYNFAAVTEFVLEYFGYSDAEAQPCIVKLESGAWGDHGLVFVTNKVDGSRCMVDAALSADGWMLGINDYDYDVRNIDQNATVKGNVDALDDDDNPTPIPPGELTEDAADAGDAGEEDAEEEDADVGE